MSPCSTIGHVKLNEYAVDLARNAVACGDVYISDDDLCS
jgi:hypothetical protein